MVRNHLRCKLFVSEEEVSFGCVMAPGKKVFVIILYVLIRKLVRSEYFGHRFFLSQHFFLLTINYNIVLYVFCYNYYYKH